MPIPDRNATTIHSLAWNALGRPALAEVRPLSKEWNTGPAKDFPAWQTGDPDIESGPGESKPGACIALYNRWRATLRKNPSIPTRQDVAPFIAAWEAWKYEHSAMDFTDLLEEALRQDVRLPYGVDVFVVDETQDLSPLLLAVADLWGASCHHYIQAGDAAQVLYNWLGASPEPLLIPLGDGRERLLGQSYRLSATVHAIAERWLGYHSPPLTDGRTYKPTEDTGLVEWRHDLSPTTGEKLAEALTTEAQIQPVTLLAHCGYQLQGVLSALREAGEPFHNPLRPSEKAWNPLGEGGHGVSTMSRVRAILDPLWDQPAIALWAELFKKDAFTDKAGLMAKESLTVNELHHFLVPAAVEGLAMNNLRSLEPFVYARFAKVFGYAAKVGAARLTETPRISIGTVHSYKGGESPVVYYLPQVSPAGYRESLAPQGWDSLVRQRYVGMTRAKEALVLCTDMPDGYSSVPVEHEFMDLEDA